MLQVESLERLGFQAEASPVVDHCIGHRNDAISGQMETPAEIDFFHMHIERFIQETHLVQSLYAKEHRSPQGPEDVNRAVVLTFVLLNRVEHPPTAERVGISIHQPPGCPLGVETLFLLHRTRFGLGGSDFRIPIHPLDKRAQPTRRDLHVVIEEHRETSLRHLETAVTATRQTLRRFPVSPTGLNDPNVRPSLQRAPDAAVIVRLIVSDDDLEGDTVGVVVDRLQAVAQDVAEVVRNDDRNVDVGCLAHSGRFRTL